MTLYGGLSASLVIATATVHKVVEEELTQVEFANAPEPPPPPPPPPEQVQAAVAAARPAVKRPKLTPPDKISDEKLKESNDKLAAGEAAGPVDGFLDGVEGGTGTARVAPPPPAPPATVSPPVPASSNANPRYSPKLKRKGVEGVVVVAFEVTASGTVANPRIVSGPADFHELVLRAVAGWRFKPAMRAGKPIAYRKQQTIRFRLEDA